MCSQEPMDLATRDSFNKVLPSCPDLELSVVIVLYNLGLCQTHTQEQADNI